MALHLGTQMLRSPSWARLTTWALWCAFLFFTLITGFLFFNTTLYLSPPTTPALLLFGKFVGGAIAQIDNFRLEFALKAWSLMPVISNGEQNAIEDLGKLLLILSHCVSQLFKIILQLLFDALREISSTPRNSFHVWVRANWSAISNLIRPIVGLSKQWATTWTFSWPRMYKSSKSVSIKSTHASITCRSIDSTTHASTTYSSTNQPIV